MRRIVHYSVLKIICHEFKCRCMWTNIYFVYFSYFIKKLKTKVVGSVLLFLDPLSLFCLSCFYIIGSSAILLTFLALPPMNNCPVLESKIIHFLQDFMLCRWWHRICSYVHDHMEFVFERFAKYNNSRYQSDREKAKAKRQGNIAMELQKGKAKNGNVLPFLQILELWKNAKGKELKGIKLQRQTFALLIENKKDKRRERILQKMQIQILP